MKDNLLHCPFAKWHVAALLLLLLLFMPLRAATVQHLTMPCTLLQGISEREYVVCLPDGYNPQAERPYPVLYLLHGGGGSCDEWEVQCRLSEAVDSLTRAGALGDGVVVICAEGNKNNMMYFDVPWWTYETYFFDELIPYMERTYRIRTDKAGRAIAGFSMGGGGATVYGVHHPDKFAFVYSISGYQRRQPLEFLRNDPSAEWRQTAIEDNNPIPRILDGTDAEVEAWRQVEWNVAVGDQDFTLEANMDLVKALRARGIRPHMTVTAGDHNSYFVRPHMIRALQKAARL